MPEKESTRRTVDMKDTNRQNTHAPVNPLSISSTMKKFNSKVHTNAQHYISQLEQRVKENYMQRNQVGTFQTLLCMPQVTTPYVMRFNEINEIRFER